MMDDKGYATRGFVVVACLLCAVLGAGGSLTIALQSDRAQTSEMRSFVEDMVTRGVRERSGMLAQEVRQLEERVQRQIIELSQGEATRNGLVNASQERLRAFSDRLGLILNDLVDVERGLGRLEGKVYGSAELQAMPPHAGPPPTQEVK
jgi:uncharacterized protein HemX